MQLFIGLMSGTSMDGIDAALVDVSNHKLLKGITRPYSAKAERILRHTLEAKTLTPHAIPQLNTVIGQEFAEAVLELIQLSGVSPQEIIAIGSHGQTICHDAFADIPYTLQVGCGHTIAERTGLTVVADFRTRDLVVGGQGAPFAPIYHQALFDAKTWPLALVNIGGISNVSYLADKTVSGYDVGPGNCLMDVWIKKHQDLAYDKNGEWAATGKVIQPLLTALLDDPFFKLPFPKSIGKEYFSEVWLSKHLLQEYKAQDVQATLLALTASTIADAIIASNLTLKNILICGGGAHNEILLHHLQRLLPALSIQSTSSMGINPDFIEAMMFAWLAEKTINRTPLNLGPITGAKKPVILGAIYL